MRAAILVAFSVLCLAQYVSASPAIHSAEGRKGFAVHINDEFHHVNGKDEGRWRESGRHDNQRHQEGGTNDENRNDYADEDNEATEAAEDLAEGSAAGGDYTRETDIAVICYHGSWSVYRAGNGKFAVNETPVNLCTHYIYTFVGLNASTNEAILLDPYADIDLGGLAAAANLKNTNPDLKIILAVGGWNEGSAKYSAMASNATSRATFIASALNLTQAYNFDGFDVDWEYPARREGSNNVTDKENFALLCKEFHEVFNPLGLLVTAAVSAAPSTVDISYDVPALSKYLDFINVMAYDFHSYADNFTGFNAPLYSSARLANTEYADYSVNASIIGWLERGASPAKIALGIPLYGKTNTLSNLNETTPGAPAAGVGGPAGPYTQESGVLSYTEIIESFAANNWTQAWDDEAKVPYAYLNSTWLSYDNEKSITYKVELAKRLGLGAVMIWSLENDDYLGLSTGTKFPLLSAINSALGRPTTTP